MRSRHPSLWESRSGRPTRARTRRLLSLVVQELEPRTLLSAVSDPATTLLSQRVVANQQNFYVYQNVDSGFNHGFPSGVFVNNGNTSLVQVDPAGVDDPSNTTTGTSTDPSRLDTTRGTVLRVTFGMLTGTNFAGLNIEEPQNFGSTGGGNGDNLTGATQVVFDVRSPTGGLSVKFGVAGHISSAFTPLPQSTTYTTMSIPLSTLGLTAADLLNVHALFTVVTDGAHAPNGGTVLLDNIRFNPVPTAQQSALGFPQSTQVFGVVPALNTGPNALYPPDQVNANVSTVYESALTELALLNRGTPADLAGAKLIADTLDYALNHDNHGVSVPLSFSPVAPGLHNGYEAGDIALFNNQAPPGQGLAGDVRLAGFSAATMAGGSTSFNLTNAGASGGNNAFAVLALTSAFCQFNNVNYLNDAQEIALWIVGSLQDTSGTGYGGYISGYADQVPLTLQTGKSVENNADIYAAFSALASIYHLRRQPANAQFWTDQANVAGDFVIKMYDATKGRFNAGTVPVGTPMNLAQGINPSGAIKGNDVINTFDFIDADTTSTLALAATPRYRTQIDWRLPVNYAAKTFAQTITAGGLTYQGFNLVKQPVSGANGIAWEFTGQEIEAMQLVDRLYNTTQFAAQANLGLGQIRLAQTSAPFHDGLGLVASTLQNSDTLTPINQTLNTPFQRIPERVGLAATSWALFADQGFNPFYRVHTTADYNGGARTNLAIYDATSSYYGILYPSGGSQITQMGDLSHKIIPVAGDYNGDGKTDTAIYDVSTAYFGINLSCGGGAKFVQLGTPGDKIYPLGGDYDGDGKTDTAIYDATIGVFGILYSGGGSLVTPMGNPKHTIIPVVGDFNGDGKTDLAIYDATTGYFGVNFSGGGSEVVQIGDPHHTLIPAVGDYNGDGKTDLAIYDQTSGYFGILYTGGGSLIMPLGNPLHTIIPVPGDYDGDGKTDVAIYDATTGYFGVNYSNGGSLIAQLGDPMHKILPALGTYRGYI